MLSKGIKYLIPILLLLSMSCHKSIDGNDNGDDQYYDPRNISRTETQSFGPHLALGGDGTVYVAWMDGGETQYDPSHIYFRYKEGDEWSDIEVISDTAYDCWSPHLVVDPFGNVHVVWEVHYWGNRICYRERYEGGGWSEVRVISGTSALQPRIGVDSSGVVHVVWNEGMGMKYRERYADGNWSDEVAVPVGSQGSINPDMVVDEDGGVHVVYEAGNQEIKYIYRSPEGEWSEPVQVSESKWYSWLPSVAVGSDGEVWVIWTDEGGDCGRVMIRKKDVGGGWSEVDTVGGICGMPRLKELFRRGDEEYLMVGDGEFRIYGVKGEGGEWGEVEEPLGETMGYVFDGEMDGNGVIHIVWSYHELGDGDNWEVYYDELEGIW